MSIVVKKLIVIMGFYERYLKSNLIICASVLRLDAYFI